MLGTTEQLTFLEHQVIKIRDRVNQISPKMTPYDINKAELMLSGIFKTLHRLPTKSYQKKVLLDIVISTKSKLSKIAYDILKVSMEEITSVDDHYVDVCSKVEGSVILNATVKAHSIQNNANNLLKMQEEVDDLLDTLEQYRAKRCALGLDSENISTTIDRLEAATDQAKQIVDLSSVG